MFANGIILNDHEKCKIEVLMLLINATAKIVIQNEFLEMKLKTGTKVISN